MGILDKFKKIFSFGKKSRKEKKNEQTVQISDADIILTEEKAEIISDKPVEKATPVETADISKVSLSETEDLDAKDKDTTLEDISPVNSVEQDVEIKEDITQQDNLTDEELVLAEGIDEVTTPLVDFSSVNVMTEDERDELLAFLIKADFGVMLAEELLDIVEEYPPEERTMRLRQLLASYLPPKPEPIKVASAPPTVYYFFGVNGVGKTTTIAKFAAILKEKGKVLLIGADTFRAAATDQLGLWARKVGVDAHLGERGADPSSVIYTGVEKAKARGYDYVLVDTAGRMSTKKNLIEELKKMERVVKKIVPDAPHESFLVLDATQGQAAFRQAKTFMNAVTVSRIILTKLDSTAKGGFIFSIWKELGIPIAFLSFGQELRDWVEYSPSVILNNLFEEGR